MWLVFLVLTLVAWPLQAAQQPAARRTQRTEVVGCVARAPDGALQLGATRSGKVYLLPGSAMLLAGRVNQLVRVSGESLGSQAPALIVHSVQPLARSCTSVLPAGKPEAVPGKVGADVAAVPVTTTRSAGHTTPGMQTQADVSQGPGSAVRLRSPAAKPGYAPWNRAQAGQSGVAADRNAAAAARTEIVPGRTLGVITSAASSPPSARRASPSS